MNSQKKILFRIVKANNPSPLLPVTVREHADNYRGSSSTFQSLHLEVGFGCHFHEKVLILNENLLMSENYLHFHLLKSIDNQVHS